MRRKNAAEKYSTLPEESSSGVAPLTVSLKRERKRVSSAKRPLVSLADVAEVVADAEGRSFEDRERHSIVADDAGAGRLRERHHDDLVHVHVRRPRDREEDAVRDVLGAIEPPTPRCVDRARLLLVAAEAHAREVGLDEARRDGRDADRPAEQVLAERLRVNARTAHLEVT